MIACMLCLSQDFIYPDIFLSIADTAGPDSEKLWGGMPCTVPTRVAKVCFTRRAGISKKLLLKLQFSIYKSD